MAATSVAHPNIALAKYWGKLDAPGNCPAVPSLSVTLAGMTTRTGVAFYPELAADELILDGRAADGRPLARVIALLDEVRAAAGLRCRARVVSANDFPTGSGLASSASGFAALAVAAATAAGLGWDRARLADLARRASASAARSLHGGFVELDDGPEAMARPVAPASHLDLVVLACVTTRAAKEVSSSEGMRVTQERSPYYAAWVATAGALHARLRAALLEGDFDAVGALAETSALAMHASAIAAGVVYWNATTVALLAAVRRLRADGVPAYATMDAGPHVKVLVQRRCEDPARAALRLVPGVLDIIRATPGEGARVLGAS